MTAYLRTKSLRNPVTGECKHVPSHEATRLRYYGWEHISLSEFKAWQVAQWTVRNCRYYDNYKLDLDNFNRYRT